MAKGRTTPQRLPDAVREAVERTIQATVGSAQQTRGRAQEAVDDIVRGAEETGKTVRTRVQKSIDRTRPATHEDINDLRAEITKLSRRLDKVEKDLAAGKKRAPASSANKRKK
jgi:polyhydroxyalkanoate synthesis regulator phasin